ncbi:hypothetical protein Acor_83860 [Acrocarpospora corrugata]|uniref:Uncharacterized protein n=1 Tax=Acrocarpospora corrugata TaxID=35763 RepID=A0A5M3WBA1_9ACTN|nr:hypothetical protein [Acrocarpospora corrugata]GES06317.1 hypothetical protein Acor_83860 [Acrocarpospora corrugata]
MPLAETDDALADRAKEFADNLTTTVHGVVGDDVPPFEAIYLSRVPVASSSELRLPLGIPPRAD